MRKFTVVGKSVPKVDALPLSLGSPLFTDDVEFRGMLTAKILWSPYAHAKIKAIDTSAAEAFPGVHAVICHKNVPRVLHILAGPYGVIFMDPPYVDRDIGRMMEQLAGSVLVGPGTTLVVEHSKRVNLEAEVGPLQLAKRRRHGDTVISIYCTGGG